MELFRAILEKYSGIFMRKLRQTVHSTKVSPLYPFLSWPRPWRRQKHLGANPANLRRLRGSGINNRHVTPIAMSQIFAADTSD